MTWWTVGSASFHQLGLLGLFDTMGNTHNKEPTSMFPSHHLLTTSPSHLFILSPHPQPTKLTSPEQTQSATMSADVAAPVLPDGKEDGKDEEVRSPFDPNLPEDPRHSEWIKQSGHATRVAYNYAAYNMTEAERRAAEGEGPILAPGDVLQDEGWANNATVYEWCDEFGDVGPAHPVLEKQLFGSDVHVTTGIDFSGYVSCSSIPVLF
jgi:hypothetical protein